MDRSIAPVGARDSCNFPEGNLLSDNLFSHPVEQQYVGPVNDATEPVREPEFSDRTT